MLKIETLGSLHISLNDQPVAFAARRAEVLLVYLLLTERAHEREPLATMLWDNRTQKRSLSNLRSLLAQLPAEIKPFLHVTRRSIGIEPDMMDEIWMDTAVFQASLATPTPNLSLYKGPFLDGVFISDSKGLEHWMAQQRQRFAQQAILAIEQQVNVLLHARDYANGIELIRKAVQLDPLRETAQRLLMRLLGRTGNITAALQQYHELTQLLRRELDISPATETQQLFARLTAARQQTPLRIFAQLTPFVGRASELTTLLRLLDQPNVRLVTLLGTGGVGKTRLALAAAEAVQQEFLNGVAFVPLASLTDAAGIVAVLAQRVGCTLTTKQPPQTQLLSFLGQRELLLVLDNIEHLLPDAAIFVQALLDLPSVTLLVTSRERLRLSVEHLFDVVGLATDKAEADAQQLFMQCAIRVNTQFAAPAATVQTVCQLVDGLPLGIELMAAATRQKSLAEITAVLQFSLQTVQSDLHDTPARHRSLHAVFDYSWMLLSGEEQDALQKLTIFNDGWTKEAAQAVAGVNGRLLQRLLDQSLIYQENGGRYAMLAVVRQYLLEAHPIDAPQLAAAHATYFAAWLDEEGSFRLLPELGNILAAWRWAAQHDAPLLALLLPHLMHHYVQNGPYADGEQRLKEAQAQLSDLDTREMVTIALLELLRRQSKLNEAEEMAARVSTMSTENQPAFVREQGLLALANGRFDEATAQLTEAVKLAQQEDDYVTAGIALRSLGVIEAMRGQTKAAKALFEQALSLFETADDPIGISQSLNNLGIACKNLNQFDEARAHYERARDIFEQMGEQLGESKLLNNLGIIARIQQDYDAAHTYFDRALTLKQRLGERQGEILALNNLGIVAAKRGKLAAGAERLEFALHLTQQWHERRHEGMVLSNLGLVRQKMGEWQTAVSHCETAVVIATELGDQNTEAYALLHWGQALIRLEDWDAAQEKLTAAMRLRQLLKQPHLHREAQAHYAHALWLSGDQAAAQQQIAEVTLQLDNDALQLTESPETVQHLCQLIGA